MIYVFFANGFEEIEALATLDILRRLQLPVQTVSIKGARQVCGAHGMMMKADCLLRKNELRQSQGIILPGGMPGAANLNSNEAVKKFFCIITYSTPPWPPSVLRQWYWEA